MVFNFKKITHIFGFLVFILASVGYFPFFKRIIIIIIIIKVNKNLGKINPRELAPFQFLSNQKF